jgi:hypothetical protein
MQDIVQVRVKRDSYALLSQAAQREERKICQALDRAIRLYATGQLETVT